MQVRRFCTLVSLLGLGFLCLLAAEGADTPKIAEKPRDEQIRPLITQYCFACHNAQVMTAGLDMKRLLDEEDVFKNHRLWKHVAERIEAGTMPPADPKPSDAERKLLTGWIEQALTNADWDKVKDPGVVALPRLTRDEYANTVRDLFGVVVDASRVLTEDAEGPNGFVNDRAALLMTDRQLERYFEVAQLVVDTVFAARDGEPVVMRYEAENVYKSTILYPTETTLEGVTGYHFRSGRITKYQNLEQDVEIPRSGTYRLRFRARTTKPGRKGGLWIAFDRIDDFKRDASILVEGSEFGVFETSVFLPAGHHRLMTGFDFDLVPWLPKVPDRPRRKLPTVTKWEEEVARRTEANRPKFVSWEELEQKEGFQIPEGEKLAAAQQAVNDLNKAVFDDLYKSYETARFHYEHNYLPIGSPGEDRIKRLDRMVDKLADLTGLSNEAIWALWESHYTGRFLESRSIHEKHLAEWEAQRTDRDSHVADVFLDWFELEGPVETEGEGAVARVLPRKASPKEILTDLLPRAFRRPLRQSELEEFLGLYRSQRSLAADAETALRRTLMAVLVSPHFLYRSEMQPMERGIVPLDDFQLASRLSYFLWSSMPDGELRAAAQAGKLSSEQGLAEQLDRMLNDPRLRTFTWPFTQQWLDLSTGESIPDSELVREFSWHLAEDMHTEVALNFERLFKEDRSVLELLDSDESFLNERLARLYDIEGVEGAAFRLVRLNDPRRGGLLGTSAVLTATSHPVRTSPVLRGKFVIEKILGEKFPPPPDNVGNLPDDAGNTAAMTLRETLAAHRRKPACAACHDRLDPMGFVLENYDIVGRWRRDDPGGPVDSRAKLPDGTEFSGPMDFKRYLFVHRADDFARSLTENVLAYALGRELDYYDVPAVNKILDAVKSNGYRARTLLREVVTSYPFRFRHARPVEVGAPSETARVASAAARLGQAEWVSLFNGQDLTGWKAFGGGAWTVENGAVVGKAAKAEKRSGYLFHEGKYGDFELRFRYRTHSGNSGVFIRTFLEARQPGNRIQVELDHRDPQKHTSLALTGTKRILAENPEAARQAFQPGKWTTMTIRAAGDSLTVECNGTKTIDYLGDDVLGKGGIALQTHGSDDVHMEFKDIYIRPIEKATTLAGLE